MRTPEQLHEDLERQRDAQRFQYEDARRYDPTDPVSQVGRPLTVQQVLDLLQPSISVIAIRAFNPYLKRDLMGLYIQDHAESKLRFICACETTVMPEWDIVNVDEHGIPTGQVRGWRSVLGIFYQNGLLSTLPIDDQSRIRYWQVRATPPNKI